MAVVEEVVEWYKELREADDLQASVMDEIGALTKEMMSKDFSQGLSEAELSVKLTEAKEKRAALSKRYVRLENDTPPMPDISGMTEAERAAVAERLRNDELLYARRLIAEGDPRGHPELEALAHLVDFDPKQGGLYYSRFTPTDLTKFDLDEESPIGPMRFTDTTYKVGLDYKYLFKGVNFLSVKIASSDVGFPILVYGSIIVRDSVDQRCVYHFRRNRDHCQLINSEAESLILTGPKRGLALCGDMYVETNLKMKGHLGQQDQELSKGLVTIRSSSIGPSDTGSRVQTKSLATRLSTVDMVYTVVDCALEGTIAVEVLQGGFHGKITAYTASTQQYLPLVLYDSKEVDDATTAGDCGDIQLMRPVVSVKVTDLLIIVVQTSDSKSQTIPFTPMINGRDEDLLTVGTTKMRVKLSWSVMDP